jgi:hypothetical protein
MTKAKKNLSALGNSATNVHSASAGSSGSPLTVVAPQQTSTIGDLSVTADVPVDLVVQPNNPVVYAPEANNGLDSFDSTTLAQSGQSVENVHTNSLNPQANTFVSRFDNINNRLKLTQAYLREINTDLTFLNKEYQKLNKPIHKKKNCKKAGDTSRSGITQEVEVSKELEKFMGLKDGERVSRTAVTRAVTAYIKSNNLQEPTNRRNILLDETLSKLLNPPKEEKLTYFNLQRYLKVHYRSSGTTPVGTLGAGAAGAPPGGVPLGA